jgi:hypothetical protein
MNYFQNEYQVIYILTGTAPCQLGGGLPEHSAVNREYSILLGRLQIFESGSVLISRCMDAIFGAIAAYMNLYLKPVWQYSASK